MTKAYVWMCGTKAGVAKGEYKWGPSRDKLHVQAQMDLDDILVGKDTAGNVVAAYDGAHNLDDYQGPVE